MLETISCWEMNWGAIGAVLTGLGAIATSITAGVALWVGLEPRRLQKDVLQRKTVVAQALLLPEIQRINEGIRGLCIDAVSEKLVKDDELREMQQHLDNSVLKELLSLPEAFPLDICVAMADVYQHSVKVANHLSFLRRIMGDDGVIRLRASFDTAAMPLRDALANLEALLDLHATNRSVSYTPSDTPESM